VGLQDLSRAGPSNHAFGELPSFGGPWPEPGAARTGTREG
jgi:hypothetical protein